MSLKRDNIIDDSDDVESRSRLSDATSGEFSDLNKTRILDTLYQSLLTRYVSQATLAHRAGGLKRTRLKSDRPVAVNVLDVGCANACALSLYQTQAFSTPGRARIDYIGLDLDTEALALARRVKVQPRNTAQFIHHDITTPWPVESDWADVVWFTEAIEHVPVHTAGFTLAETRRVLAPDGVCLLSTPAPLHGEMRWPDGHDHEFTREELAALIAESGLVIADQWGIGNRIGPEAHRIGGTASEIYDVLRRRVGHAFAGTAVAALYPETSEDLVWLLRRPR